MHVYSLYFVAGLFAGGIVVWLLRKYKFESSRGVSQEKHDSLSQQYTDLFSDKSRLEERAVLLESKADELKNELAVNKEENESLKHKLTKLETEHANLQERLESRKEELQEIQKKFSAEFENLANKILEEKSTRFAEQNKTSITEILKPLNEKIVDFQKRVEETYDKESKQRFSLEKELTRLFDLNERITKEASNLTSALKGESKTQGNWGEAILETLLEKSGLQKDVHYEVQKSLSSEDGSRLQPDVIINLPEGKNMIIDSKVSLTAYERYYSTEGEKEKEDALAQHAASMKRHIDELSEKDYQNIYGINGPDFVLMFVPIEPALALAVRHEPGLLSEAVEKNVAIISPSILLATLRMIVNIWRQENQSRNALEIARQSGALYDKFVGFVDDLRDVEKGIQNTRKSYDSAFGKLKSGKGNLISRIEKIKKLGAKAGKNLPQEITAEAIEDDVPQLGASGQG